MTSRLLKLLTCFMLFMSAPAFALDYTWGISGSYGVCVSGTPEATCSCYAEKMTAAESPTSYSFTRLTEQSPTGRYCWAMRAGSASDQYIALTTRNGDGCAPPKTLTPSGGCAPPPPPECLPPKMLINGVCMVPPPVCKAGEKWVVSVGENKTPKNRGGCAVTVVSLLKCFKTPQGNYCTYEVELTGGPAQPEDPDVTPDPEGPPVPPDGPRVPSPPVPPKSDGSCPPGTVQAGQTASGTPICIGTGTAPDNAPPGGTSSGATVTSTDAAGIKTTTQDTTRTNADGSTTTTTTTIVVNPDGSSSQNSTSTTTDAIDGKPGVSDGAKDGKGFCEQNPTLSICRNSSVSGSCGEIACTGDAVQCATLRAAAAMECRTKKSEEDLAASPLTTLGNQVGTGNDPIKGTFPTPANGQQVVVPSSLDDSGWLGGGSCFSDKSFSMQGHVIVIPISEWCDYLVVLRYALLMVAGLVSIRILSGAVLNN